MPRDARAGGEAQQKARQSTQNDRYGYSMALCLGYGRLVSRTDFLKIDWGILTEKRRIGMVDFGGGYGRLVSITDFLFGKEGSGFYIPLKYGISLKLMCL